MALCLLLLALPGVAALPGVVALPGVLSLPGLVASVRPVLPTTTYPLPEPGGGELDARLRSGVPAGSFMRAVAAAEGISASPLSQLHPWIDRGPADPGGRVTDLAFDGQTLWVASASGGLWRSDASAEVLTPAWPLTSPPAIGAVAVLADGTLLVGTGEANAGGGSTTFAGDGVHRSTDQGRTWTRTGLGTSATIARIVAHPTDPRVAWAAAGGDLYRGGGDRGIYRTDDGGVTWTQVLAGATATSGGADLTIDPADPDHLLATTWDRQRTPSLRRYGGVGSGLHASHDGGLTWTPVTAGIPGFTDDVGRIAVAFSPADPSAVYANVTGGDGRGVGLFRSDDGGATFHVVNRTPGYLANQFIFGYWFGKVFPAPDDADRVLVPGLNLMESTDGGASFTLDRGVHADQHALIFDPADPSRAWLGTDGGVYRSTAGGVNFSWMAARQQPFTQAYDAAALPADPSRLAAGLQDNGCLRWDGIWQASAPCGDGTTIVAHPREAEFILCGQYARCWRSSAEGVEPLARPPVARAAWSTPVVRLSGDPEALLLGGERLMRSDDGGQSWRSISPDLTRGRSPDPDYPHGTITEILSRDADGQRIVVGTDDGLVQSTEDGGATWRVLVDADRWVTGLAQSPDGSALLIATSGFFQGEGTAQVRRSSDGGITWEDIAGGLPDAPANDLLVVDHGGGSSTVVVATDVGAYAAAEPTAPGTPTWRRVGEDLPQVPVLSLQHVAEQSTLTIGTFGRGVWQTGLTSVSRHAGPDRYATAVAVNDVLGSAGAASGGTVVLANGRNPADALAGAPLVAQRPGWRLLLTDATRLPEATAQALERVAPSEVLVLGGEAAISEGVVAEVRARAGDPDVRRIAGQDRAETAALLAAEHGPSPTVLLATSRSPYDALAGAPLAAALGGVVLSVDPDRLPQATADALASLRPERIIALGGPASISQAVLNQAEAAANSSPGDAHTRQVQTSRIAGEDRVATSALIAARVAAERSSDSEEVWLASATGPSDALVAASSGSPLLLVTRSAAPQVILEAIAELRPLALRVAGGQEVVDAAVLERLRHGPPLPQSRQAGT